MKLSEYLVNSFLSKLTSSFIILFIKLSIELSKKGTCPTANSNKMQPKAHKSLLNEYLPSFLNNSGAV